MDRVLRRARRTALHKLLSAVFLCLIGLVLYLALLGGGGWWIALLLLTAAQGLEAQQPAGFFNAAAVVLGILLLIEWARRRKRSFEPASENISWLRVPMDLLLLGPGCVFSLWDLAGSARRLLFLNYDAIREVLRAMGPMGSIPIAKLNGAVDLGSDVLQRAIHAMQLLDLVYLTERNGALVLAANDGAGKTVCRQLRRS